MSKPSNEKYIADGPFYYDDGAFFIWKTRWGTWSSADKDGRGLCCGIDKDAVEFFSREKLTGYPNCWTSVTKARVTGEDTL